MPKQSPDVSVLSDILITNADAIAISDQIDLAISSSYKLNVDQDTHFIDRLFYVDYAIAIKTAIASTTESIPNVLADIKKHIATFEKINITFAFMPSKEFMYLLKLNLSKTFRNSDFYFIPVIDTSICGGFKLMYRGIIYEKTLLSSVTEFYKAKGLTQL